MHACHSLLYIIMNIMRHGNDDAYSSNVVGNNIVVIGFRKKFFYYQTSLLSLI